MTDVTVLFLDETFSSTAIGPMEVFRHAGTLWNFLTGKRQVPRFRVTTASADGRAVRCDGPIHIQPMAALTDIRRTDLIFIPTTGLESGRRGRAQCAGCALAAALAQARSCHRQCVLRRGSGRSHRLARRQTRHHPLGLGRALPREISQGELDAGIDGDRGPRLLLRRRGACGARPQPVSGGAILRPRGCHAKRQGDAHRDAARMAGRVRHRPSEEPSIPTTTFPARRSGCIRIFTRLSRSRLRPGAWA